ncbi:MAG: radical SAM protein, partial [Dehalococcoidia bacterium]|nr:radical SAM protein [Dehalococcoidia bacterium]
FRGTGIERDRMAKFSPLNALRVAGKGIRNYIIKRPLIVSFEVTLSCNCNCRHCDLGGLIKDEKQIGPDDYARLTRLLNPPLLQISGGEPLLRKDIVDIVRAMRQASKASYLILVTNGVTLHESNYVELHEAGVNQLSVSLDFPDERHDEFRRHRGLYRHLAETIPRLARLGYGDIILNTAITRANLREVLPLAEKAREWGVSMSYSAYTPLRTRDKGYLIDSPEELAILRRSIYDLIELRKRTTYITNPKAILLDTLRFFENGYMPDCKAGIRFFVVMPDGAFVPCSLHRNKYSSQKEMIEDFSRTNQCGGCYVAIRSYSDKGLGALLKDTPELARGLFHRYGGNTKRTD